MKPDYKKIVLKDLTGRKNLHPASDLPDQENCQWMTAEQIPVKPVYSQR
jgi:hypothetical protein